MPMRRLLPILLLALVLVPVAGAVRPQAPGDGTLSVRNGEGDIRLLAVRGALVGRLGSGVIEVEVEASRGDSCDELPIFGETKTELRKRKSPVGTVALCVLRGAGIRFRLTGEQSSVHVNGKDIDLSVVGKGGVMLKGRGDGLDGSYSLNGAEYQSLPDSVDWLLLGSPAAAAAVARG